MIIAILIGREGSTGFPGKNVVNIIGKPLAAWPLEAARATSVIDRTYVSTDSPRLKADRTRLRRVLSTGHLICARKKRSVSMLMCTHTR
jgi:CMP-2-keto-3-deoxyoctulosonic acid synthetase